MNHDLWETIYTLAHLDLADEAKTACWAADSKRWRIEMDEDVFLREVRGWEPMPNPNPDYPIALVAVFGKVDVFCLVKEVPK